MRYFCVNTFIPVSIFSLLEIHVKLFNLNQDINLKFLFSSSSTYITFISHCYKNSRAHVILLEGLFNIFVIVLRPFYEILFSPLRCHRTEEKGSLYKINLYFILQLCPAHCTRYSITSFPVTQSSRLTGCTSSTSLTTDIPFFVLHIERCRYRIPSHPILEEGRSCRL